MKKLSLLLLLAILGSSQVYCAEYTTYDEARDAATREIEAQHYAEARKDLEAAVALAKTSIDKGSALLAIGETYKDEGNARAERLALNKVFAMRDAAVADRLQAHFEIGTSYLKSGQTANARDDFLEIRNNKEYALAPHEKVSLGYLIGATYQQEKNYPRARQEFRQAMNSGWNDADTPVLLQNIQENYAECYLAEGNCAVARAEFDKILSLVIDTDLSAENQIALLDIKQTARLRVGQSYLAEKNYAQAKLQYQKVLEMEPLLPANKAEAEKQLQFIAGQEPAR